MIETLVSEYGSHLGIFAQLFRDSRFQSPHDQLSTTHLRQRLPGQYTPIHQSRDCGRSHYQSIEAIRICRAVEGRKLGNRFGSHTNIQQYRKAASANNPLRIPICVSIYSASPLTQRTLVAGKILRSSIA